MSVHGSILNPKRRWALNAKRTELISLLENLMNKDQTKGQIKEVKGNIKEVAGKALGDKTMENKGKVQNAVGKVQKGYGDAKEEIKKGS
jgi:uncharacterized protein YjbJ (UPF0337 family)